jgi:molybdenum cofactor cytidylyltransferase
MDLAMGSALGLDCILLAAGASSRMGRPKLLLPFRGTTIIGAAIGTVLDAGLRAIVVTRPGDEELRRALAGRAGVELVVNPEPERGMLSSLQAGAPRVRTERFFFLPADMPFVGMDVFYSLATRRVAGPVIPIAGGRKGHPVLMPSALIPALLALPYDAPLKDLILASCPSYEETGDEAVLRDIDTGSDYAEALRGDAVEAAGRIL